MAMDDGHLDIPAGMSPSRIAAEAWSVARRIHLEGSRYNLADTLRWRSWCGFQGALENAASALAELDAGRTDTARTDIKNVIDNLRQAQLQLALYTHPADCDRNDCQVRQALVPHLPELTH